MKLTEIAIAVLEEYATKEEPIHTKELHYRAEYMFSSKDYSPERVARRSPEKSIASVVGKMVGEDVRIKQVKKKVGSESEKNYYYVEDKPFGNTLVMLEDGTKVRAQTI